MPCRQIVKDGVVVGSDLDVTALLSMTDVSFFSLGGGVGEKGEHCASYMVIAEPDVGETVVNRAMAMYCASTTWKTTLLILKSDAGEEGVYTQFIDGEEVSNICRIVAERK